MSVDIFDDFAPEPGSPGSGTGRVSDILARGVTIRWDEAVALLQDILEIAMSRAGDSALVPGFEDVVIDREGAVKVIASRRGERGPVAAGRALHALLATADVPLPLRLFVTQANAPETHKSLQAFAEGLAYFGKSGRADLIRTIFDRYNSSAVAVAANAAGTTSPPPPATLGHDVPTSNPRRPLHPWLVPAAVVLGVVSLVAAIGFGIVGARGANTASIVARAKSALASVTPSIANTTTAAADATSPVAEAPARRSEKRSSRQGSRPHATSTGVASIASSARSSAARPVAPILSPASATQAPTPSAEDSPAIVPVAREVVVAPRESSATTIYSPADADVQPPVMMYPSLPPAVFVAKNADVVVVNRMELVIAADGSVERVRLVNGPSRMPDMMLLSGAKLWKFTPAMKDGVPVRFRTTVTWTGFP